MPTFTISVNNKVLGTYVVKKTVVSIGRSRTNTISIASKAVSRNHVRIENTADGWTIADLGSLNGTYVNDIRINSAFLSDGDRITVGAYAITFSPEPLQSGPSAETHVAAVQHNEPEGTDTDVRLESASVSDASAPKEQTDVAESREDVPLPPQTTAIPVQPVVEDLTARVDSDSDGKKVAPTVQPRKKPDPSLQLGEKIKIAIFENPLADENWIRARLSESDFGEERISKQQLSAILREMDLDSNLKRYHYFMNS